MSTPEDQTLESPDHQGHVDNPSTPKREVNLKKRITVGSLLIPSSDMDSPPTTPEAPPQPSLARRLTNKLQPPPDWVVD